MDASVHSIAKRKEYGAIWDADGNAWPCVTLRFVAGGTLSPCSADHPGSDWLALSSARAAAGTLRKGQVWEEELFEGAWLGFRRLHMRNSPAALAAQYMTFPYTLLLFVFVSLCPGSCSLLFCLKYSKVL